MRHGVTLIEVAIVLVVMGVVCAFGVPPLLRFVERARVRHAANEIVSTLGFARTAAVGRAAYVTVHVDPVRSSLAVTTGRDTLLVRDLAAVYGVRVRSNRDSIVYGPTGLGHGAANQTVVIRRGDSQDSVIISRLGRIRR